MKNLCLSIITLCTFALFLNCKRSANENSSDQKVRNCTLTEIRLTEEDSRLQEEENSDNTSLFNPNYKPFYGEITIHKIIESCGLGTASGPGNPFTIECMPEYKDKATGSYYIFTPAIEDDHDSFFLCEIYVSLNGEGFYADDTTQRINTLLLYDDHPFFDETFPFQIHQETDIDSLQRIDPDLYLYREKDYEFYLLMEENKIKTMLINRLYCENQSTDTSMINMFLSLSERNDNLTEKTPN